MNTSRYMIGYAQTTTIDQNLDAQVIALKAAGCSVVRTEQKSGTSLDGRPELKTILDFIQAGETLVVTRIDRLARSLSDLQAIVTRLKEKGAHLAARRHLDRDRQGVRRNARGLCRVRNQSQA